MAVTPHRDSGLHHPLPPTRSPPPALGSGSWALHSQCDRGARRRSSELVSYASPAAHLSTLVDNGEVGCWEKMAIEGNLEDWLLTSRTV
ncbi:hypothetical protein J6590_034277 [Homalodisca vitripennis]|nr:hypothetical protein J6590_034277 [Homalodisca vitripennis]